LHHSHHSVQNKTTVTGLKVKKKLVLFKIIKNILHEKELPHCFAMLVFHFFYCGEKNEVFNLLLKHISLS